MRCFKKFYIILSIGLIFSACEKDDNNPVIKKEELRTHTTLIINNYHPYYGHSSYNENAIFEVYNNLNSFEDYFAAPLPWEKREFNSDLPDSLLDDNLESLDGYTRETFKYDSVQPGTYYFKSFNAYNHERFVEFNDAYKFDISSPLDSLEVINILTKRYYIKSFNLKEMYVYLNNLNLRASKNKVKVKFYKFYPSGYAGPPPTTFFEDSVAVDQFPYRKSIQITINEFNSWWCDPYFYLSISGSGFTDDYEIKIFDLLNLNKRFTDSLVYSRFNHPYYKLYGDWTTE